MLDYRSTADDILNAEPEIAILPIGSTEQHGPHLPLCTDFIIAQEISREISVKANAYLLPALPISTCYEHKGKIGSVYMRPNTFYQVIQDIILCLNDQGFRKVAVVLGHGGIFVAGPSIRELNAMVDDLKVAKIDFLQFFNDPELLEILSCHDDLHAGEYETSLMLYLMEEAVKKDKMDSADFIPTVPRDYLNYASLIKLSKTGVWGKASLGTKEKGRRIFKLLADRSLRYMEQVFSDMGYEAW